MYGSATTGSSSIEGCRVKQWAAAVCELRPAFCLSAGTRELHNLINRLSQFGYLTDVGRGRVGGVEYVVTVLDSDDTSIRSGGSYRLRALNVDGFIVLAVNHQDRACDLAYVVEHVVGVSVRFLFCQPSQSEPQYLSRACRRRLKIASTANEAMRDDRAAKRSIARPVRRPKDRLRFSTTDFPVGRLRHL